MSDPTNPLDWVEYAEQDWETAQILRRRKRLMAAVICFHAQQCAEKYLKAMPVARRAEFPKTHDLVALNTLCQQAGILTGFSPVALTLLSEYAVATRYPGDVPAPEEVDEAMGIAGTVRRFARRWLGFRNPH